jgi:Phage derived protein Gp49-like (DUF891)
MLRHYEDFLVYDGQRFSVFFHAESSDSSKVYDYYKDCDDVTRASLLYLVKRIADIGHIYDDTKFRIEDKQHKIYCFKPKKERFFCFFYTGQKIIITSGHTKKKQKLDRNELEKAVRIRAEYL